MIRLWWWWECGGKAKARWLSEIGFFGLFHGRQVLPSTFPWPGWTEEDLVPYILLKPSTCFEMRQFPEYWRSKERLATQVCLAQLFSAMKVERMQVLEMEGRGIKRLIDLTQNKQEKNTSCPGHILKECCISTAGPIHWSLLWVGGRLPSSLPHRLTRQSAPAFRGWGPGFLIQRLFGVLPAPFEFFSPGFHPTGYALGCSRNAHCTSIQIWLQTCEQFLAHELLQSNEE